MVRLCTAREDPDQIRRLFGQSKRATSPFTQIVTNLTVISRTIPNRPPAIHTFVAEDR